MPFAFADGHFAYHRSVIRKLEGNVQTKSRKHKLLGDNLHDTFLCTIFNEAGHGRVSLLYLMMMLLRHLLCIPLTRVFSSFSTVGAGLRLW